jgi:hypothetical protein
MSRTPLSLPAKLLPAALTAALMMLGSVTIANAQSYSQNPTYGQDAPQDQYGTPQDQYAQTDPSDRVARLAYTSGDVEFAPAGEDTWGSAAINRPLVTGDRLMTGESGRAALELGDAALRINDNSAFNFLDLDDTTTQVELSQGTLNLRVRTIGGGQVYEIDTPTVAFVASEPGTYRVDVAPNGNGAMVTVFEGSGTVYGENGVSRPVQAGQSYRFSDTSLANVQVQGVPAPDDFDRFCEARDSRYANSVSRQYVSPDVVGYDDLDQYGDWQDTPDYGEVWYPTQVSADWAPYRDGHWAWIEPWGWTWVDDEPWGYAPFHYGRWAYVRDRWGWVPGPRTVEPVYAPALVAFVGGSGFSVSVSIGGGGYGEPVGWFPLGPRDVYVPPYRASRNYFTSINVTNIRNVYVNKTVINNYYGSYAAGRPFAGARQYAYRNNPRAFTAVPRNVFAGARPVRTAVLHVKPGALAKATVTPIPHVAPTRASLAITPPKRPIARPVAKAFDRTVVARHAPPPRPVPFAAREKVIAKQGGAPIPVAQMRQMRQQHAQAQPERVHVIAAARAPNLAPAARPGKPPVNAPRNQPAMVQAPRRNGEHAQQPTPNRAAEAPNRAQAAVPTPQQAPLRPGELPSARFAHPHGPGHVQQQRAVQARQQAEQARQNGQVHAQSAQQRNVQQAQENEAQARPHGEQERAQQEQQRVQGAQQQQVQQERAQQAQQQRSQQEQEQQQRAGQAQQERAQREQEQRAQQEQQRAQAQQERVQREQQQRAEQEQQQRAQAQQERAQREQAQRAQQEQQQRAQAQQERAQREQEQRAQQEQQQRQAQMQQQREAQMRAQQRGQHAPPPPKKPPPKKHKDDDQQDDGH